MEIQGTVDRTGQEGAWVRLDGDHHALVLAKNEPGATAGDRVRVEVEAPFSERAKGRAYLTLAASAAGGAACGKLVGSVERVRGLLAAAGGRFAGPFISSADNLALLAGLAALAAASALLWIWLRAGWRRSYATARVIGIEGKDGSNGQG